jgi:aspartyl-tRNA(Asn)/glutamyl-tRNA(Gln) amidotransferase subunit A
VESRGTSRPIARPAARRAAPAVAVAARLAPAGIGSDTGGSVRIPCAFNGLVGLKVTFGRISLHGTMLLSWTLDSIGPMARSVEDCALLLNALAAPDPRDPTTLDQPLEDFTAAAKGGSIEGMRLALPDSSQLPEFVDPDVVQAWQSAARTFESLGATVEAVRLPAWFFDMQKARHDLDLGDVLAASQVDRGQVQADRRRRARPRLLGKEFVPGAYAEELRLMKQRRAEFAEWMRPYDALLTPAVAVPAIPLTEVDETSPVPAT